MQDKRGFKGIWIPAEIWLDDRLSAQEMVILAEIDSLDNGEGCWASNEYLAKFSKCSPATISRAIKNLISCGYLEIVSFDGRTRIMKSCLGRMTSLPNQIDEADSAKCSAITLEDNVKDNKYSSAAKAASSPGGETRDSVDYDAWRSAYETNASKLPKMRLIGDKRKAAVRSMLKQGITIDDFAEACRKADRSSFLLGGGSTGWRASADWMFNATNIVKILEGNYDDREQQHQEKYNNADSEYFDTLEELGF